MTRFYAAAAIISLFAGGLAGAFYYGKSVERAAAAEQVAALQQDLAALGLVVQKQESKAADDIRKIIEVERGRIDAIRTADHQAGAIKALEAKLQAMVSQETGAPGAGIDGPVRIILPASTVRVWEQSRHCAGLPASQPASVLQKRLHAVTGDDINRSIKFLHGQYCGCALKYNELWRACDRLLNAAIGPAVSE